MAFDPVLWLLIYLLIGSLIWMASFCAGDFEDVDVDIAFVASVMIILFWFAIAYLMVAGEVLERRVRLAEDAR